MLKRNCLHCGKEFIKKATVSLKTWETSQKCCSFICANTHKRGKYKSWNSGTKGVCIPWNKGKKCPQYSGDKNSRWTGTDDKYWKEQAKLRDNYTCVICGHYEPEIMQVDHIKQRALYPELQYCLDNLQTLCPNCHARKTMKEKRR